MAVTTPMIGRYLYSGASEKVLNRETWSKTKTSSLRDSTDKTNTTTGVLPRKAVHVCDLGGQTGNGTMRVFKTGAVAKLRGHSARMTIASRCRKTVARPTPHRLIYG